MKTEMDHSADNARTAMHEDKKKHTILKRVLLALVMVLAVLGIAFAVYVNDYYRADETAEAAITRPADDITITMTDDWIAFIPYDTADNASSRAGFIFYPGAKVEYTAYAPLCEKLAARGITCILLKMPFNFALLNVNAADGIIEEFNEGNAFAGAFLSSVDPEGTDDSISDAAAVYQPIERWYIGGHSLGGVAASMYLAEHADEYEGLVLLGSYAYADLSDTNLRILSVYGEYDGILDRTQYEESLSKLPSDVTEVVIPGGCHAGFGSYGAQDGDGTPTITNDEQQEITADAIANWINQ